MKKNKLLLSVAASAVALAPLAAHGQEAGMNVLSIGWLHVAPMQSSTPLAVQVSPSPVDAPLHLPTSFTAPGTGLHVSNTDTVGLTASHFLTDHIAVTVIGGVPPLLSISGKGTVIAPGPAGTLARMNIGDAAINPVVKSARAWTPVALLQYYFRDSDATFRPFVGAGLTYAWFSDIQLSNGFITEARNDLGAPIAAAAGKPGQTQFQAKASTSWSPVFNIGMTYRYSPSIGLTASLTYTPLQTNAVVYIKSANGQMLGQAKTKLSVDPLIPYIGMTYSF